MEINKETYIVGDLYNDWQKVMELTEEQAKVIRLLIDYTHYYIQKESEIKEKIE